MTKQNAPTIGFIGAGTTGTALAVRLAQHGYLVTAVSSRSSTSAEKLAARISGCKVYNGAQEVAYSTSCFYYHPRRHHFQGSCRG